MAKHNHSIRRDAAVDKIYSTSRRYIDIDSFKIPGNYRRAIMEANNLS